MLLPEHKAPDIVLIFDEFLKHHHHLSRFLVFFHELLGIVYLVNVSPPVTVIRLQYGGESDEVAYLVPLNVPDKVSQVAIVGIEGITVGGEAYGPGHGYTQFYGQAVVVKFIIRRQPEGIVYYIGSRKRGILQVGAVIGDNVRHPVDYYSVRTRLCHSGLADNTVLGSYIGNTARVYLVDDGIGQTLMEREEAYYFFIV